MHYYHIIGCGWISFQIWRSTGGPVTTAFHKTSRILTTVKSSFNSAKTKWLSTSSWEHLREAFERLLKTFYMLLSTAEHPRPTLLAMLQSESLSGKCVKLHTAAASNNRDHLTRSLCYCLFAPHICGCCSPHTSRSWWIVHSTQCQWRGCNSQLL